MEKAGSSTRPIVFLLEPMAPSGCLSEDFGGYPPTIGVERAGAVGVLLEVVLSAPGIYIYIHYLA